MDRLISTVDKIAVTVVDLSDRMGGVERRLSKVEDIVSKGYSRIDDFLVLFNRHDAEIAALRDAYRRLEERVETLEGQRA